MMIRFPFNLMKHCNTCDSTKRDADFHLRAASIDGLAARCCDCQSAYDRARLRKPDRVQARADYAVSAAGKEQVAAGRLVWMARHPHKRQAHNDLRKALARGAIKRPVVCQKCLRRCVPQAHHDDYSKPLDVRWLCQPCHVAHHVAERGPVPSLAKVA